MNFDEEPTVQLKDPNWKWNRGEEVGFAIRLNIIQPSDFDDEPTIPYGLCQDDNLVQAEGAELVEELELVGESDIIDDIDALLHEFLER